jgi:hypothetical protein
MTSTSFQSRSWVSAAGQIVVVERVEPADGPEAGAHVVEAQRRLEPLVGLTEGVQNRRVEPCAARRW